MDKRQFFDNVVLMRAAQKDYFKTRNKSALQRSKIYERIIDAEINLLLDDPANIEKYVSGWHVRYRNHQKDKKGRIVKVEAYLIP